MARAEKKSQNNEIYIFFMHIRNAREIFPEISDTPALFVFPEGEDSGQNPPNCATPRMKPAASPPRRPSQTPGA